MLAVTKPPGSKEVVRQDYRAYGITECSLLAQYVPEETTLNADGYAFFALVSRLLSAFKVTKMKAGNMVRKLGLVSAACAQQGGCLAPLAFGGSVDLPRVVEIFVATQTAPKAWMTGGIIRYGVFQSRVRVLRSRGIVCSRISSPTGSCLDAWRKGLNAPLR